MTQRISYKQTNNEVNKQASNIKDLQLNFLSFVFFWSKLKSKLFHGSLPHIKS